MTPYEEMQEEMRGHLEARAADLESRGMSAEAARRQARLEFGSVGRYLEEGREERAGAIWERWRLDFAMAWRSLRRQPVLLGALVLQLTLTTMVAAVAYPLVRDALWRPIPVSDVERIFHVRTRVPQLRGLYADWPVNIAHFRLWQKGCKSCEALGLVNSVALHWMDGKVARKLDALQVSAGTFSVLGLRMQLGRALREGEADAVVISEELWHTRLGGDRAVLGTQMLLNRKMMRVVGVLSSDAFLPVSESMGSMLSLPERVEALVAVPAEAGKGQGMMGYFDWGLLVKARNGVKNLAAEMDAVLVQGGMDAGDVLVELRNWDEALTSGAQGRLAAFGWAVGGWLVLSLLCCFGIARARRGAYAREEELQTQLGAALGDRWRRRCAEALCTALPAGVLGIALGAVVLQFVPRLFPKWGALRVGWEAGCATVLFAGLVYCLAWRPKGRHWEGVLQSALATMLAALSLTLAWNYVRTLEYGQGFESAGAITFELAAPRQEGDATARWNLEKAVLRELRNDPSVSAAATANRLPLEGEAALFQLRPEGVVSPPGTIRIANFRIASDGYFAAMGMKVLQGRGFVASDEGQRVVVLSASAAISAYGRKDVVGRRIQYTWNGERVWMEIVGVVDDVRAESVEGAPTSMVYVMPRPEMPMERLFVVRGQGDVGAVSIAAVGRASNEARVERARGLEELVGRRTQRIRWRSYGVGLLGLSGLVVACLGMAALVYFDVRVRRAEIGLRRALGATKRRLAWGVSAEALAPVAWGVGLGALVALGWAEWIVVLVVVCGILGSTLLTAYLPARNGVEVELREALRSDW